MEKTIIKFGYAEIKKLKFHKNESLYFFNKKYGY